MEHTKMSKKQKNSDAYTLEPPLIRRLLCLKVFWNWAGFWPPVSNHMKIRAHGVSKPVLTCVTSSTPISLQKSWSKFEMEQFNQEAFNKTFLRRTQVGALSILW